MSTCTARNRRLRRLSPLEPAGGPQAVRLHLAYAPAAAEVMADGVVRLGSDQVNWYLVEEAGVVTVVDAGLPRFRPQLEEGLRLLGRQPADVGAVILTHAHADHVGLAEPIRS